MSKRFSYCIGREWTEYQNQDICTYTIAGRNTFAGDIEDAKLTRDYVNSLNSLEDKNNKYDIYKLVKVNEDGK